MPIIAALIGGAAAIGGSLIQSSAASKAAKAGQQAAAENKKLGEQYQVQSLGDLESALGTATGAINQGTAGATDALSPYTAAGEKSLSQVMALLGLSGTEAGQTALSNFQTSPGYEFRVGEGVKALDRSANARGSLYSGAQGKALIDYGQNVGSEEFGNYFDRLTGLTTRGQQAAGDVANLRNSAGTNIAQAMLGTAQNKANVRLGTLGALTGANNQSANATGAGAINSANAWSNGLNSLSGIAGNYAGSLSGYNTIPTTYNPMTQIGKNAFGL